jgi:hypothetical protein
VTISISPQIRVVALMGVLLIALAGGYKYVLHKHANDTIAISTPVHTTPAPSSSQPRSGTHSPAKHHTPSLAPGSNKAAASAARSAASQVHLNKVNRQLPPSLRYALERHRIVVVSLWDPQAPVDYITVAEAHAGADAAGAGFVLVNVLDNKVAGPLTALLPAGDMLPDPGVLLYRAPGKVVYRFDGFLDRSSVAQAAANAKAGLDTAPAAEATLP